MAIYGSQFVEGKVQDIRYSSSTAFLFWTTKLGGKDVIPTAATYMIYDSDGDAITTTSASFAVCTTDLDECTLAFDTLTVKWNIGAVLTCASTGFTGTIRSIDYTSATAGNLYLMSTYGTIATNGKTIVDDGSPAGAAKNADSPHSLMLYATLNPSSTSTYTIGENYRMQVKWTYASAQHVDQVYFDVVYYPLEPMTTSRMIDYAHPDWLSQRPTEIRTWVHSIHAGHAELCRRIRALGNRPSFIVKREELLPYEMAFIEADITRNMLGMEKEARDYWAKRAESLWSSKGEFAYAGARDDGEVDASPKVMTYSLSR
jgi:hypothetical protein